MGKILWKRLGRIINALSGYDTTITLSTSRKLKKFHSLVRFNIDRKEAEIYLNAATCKEIDTVIRAVSHEVAHILLGGPDHGAEHERTWIETRIKITRMMEDKDGNSDGA